MILVTPVPTEKAGNLLLIAVFAVGFPGVLGRQGPNPCSMWSADRQSGANFLCLQCLQLDNRNSQEKLECK